MGSLDNLKAPTPEQAKKRGRQGGINSGKARRKKREFRECFEALLRGEITHKGEKLTTIEAISTEIIKRALKGDVKAFETIRDTIGQKPKLEVETKADPKINIVIEQAENEHKN